jgi:hypothetical protein
MYKSAKIKLFILTLLILIPSITAPVIVVAGSEQTLKPPTINVPLPGLKQWEATTFKAGDTINLPYIAHYLVAVYGYALILGSIIATIMLMGGGILYLTAGGIGGNVAKAKTLITGAVMGLVILLSSYMMLAIINPKMVQPGSVEIETVEDIEFEEETAAMVAVPGPGSVSVPGVSGGSSGKVVGSPDLKEFGSPLAGNSWCTVKTPSTDAEKSDLPGIRFDYYGSMDCMKPQKKRPASQIEVIVLHQGKSNVGKPGYASGEEKKYKTTIEDWPVYKQIKEWRRKKIGGNFGASSHYTIAMNGHIYQTIPDLHSASHAPGHNKQSIGIDLIYAKNGDKAYYTDAQYSSLAKLINNIKSKYPQFSGVIDDSHILGHGDCAYNRGDPSYFDFEKLGSLMGITLDNKLHPRVAKAPKSGGWSKSHYSPKCEFIYQCTQWCPPPKDYACCGKGKTISGPYND